MNCFKRLTIALMLGFVGLLPHSSSAATWYVSPNGNDGNSGATWALAKKTIQAGVNVAGNGDTVWVTNGEYVLSGQITVLKAITIRSVNGSTGTIVNGNGPVTLNRCFYLKANCTLDGLTVTNGYAYNAYGGGVYCENANAIITNCTLSGNLAAFGGGAIYSTLNNCTLSGNSALYGGGAIYSTLNNGTITGNAAYNNGGGASDSTLNNCTLTGNLAGDYGGGAAGGALNKCTLTGNSARYSGGGAYYGALNNCTLSGNSDCGALYSTLNNCTLSGNSGCGASGGTLNNCTLTGNSDCGALYSTLNNCTLSGNSADGGGGAGGGTLNNCTLTGNLARYGGGGAIWSTLNNCTLCANSATSGNGGGVYGGTLNNCIVYYNNGTNNFVDATVRYTCAPDAPAGFGNITTTPMFVDKNNGNYRLSAGSPCINAGNNVLAPTNVPQVDLDGNIRIWNGTVDMGAYEYGSINPYYAYYQIYLSYANYYFNRYASTRSSTDQYWGYYCYAYAGYYYYLSVGQTSQANSFYYYYMCCANIALANEYYYWFTRTGSHLYLGYYCYYTAFSYFYGYMNANDSYNAYRWYNFYMYYANWYWQH